MLTRVLSTTPSKASLIAHPRHPQANSNRVVVVSAAPTSSSVDDAPVDDLDSPVPSFRTGSRRIVLATAIVLAGTAGKALAAPKSSIGRSSKELARDAKARREKLKAASAKMREKGKAESAFEESKFALGEDATTPNRVNRTGEGGSGI